MTIPIVIVADPRRGIVSSMLAQCVGADHVVKDYTARGPAQQHRRAWEWIAGQRDASYGLVLEDDAQPVDPFAEQLHQVLAAAPSSIVSLYLGRSRPPHVQESIARTIPADPHFLLYPELLHGVGYAVDAALIPQMLEATEGAGHFTEAVSDWCRRTGRMVAYCFPSLVDHNDSLASLVPRQPTRYDESHPLSQPRDDPRFPRRAWEVGGRIRWREDRTRLLPEPEDLGATVLRPVRKA